MSTLSKVIAFVDRDAQRWRGYPLLPMLIGAVPIGFWAVLSDRPPADGPIWALVLAISFFAFWEGLAIWRGFRFEWREFKQMQELDASEQSDDSRG